MRFKDLIFRLAVTVVPLLVALASCTREEGELWAETECSLQADASIIATRAGGHAVPAAETLSGVEASGLELSDVCTGFDFKTWDVTGERAGLEFPGSACTSLPETVSGKTTLAFAYVFAPAAADFRAGLTLTLTAKGGVEQRSLMDVPLRANHLTNVQYSNR